MVRMSLCVVVLLGGLSSLARAQLEGIVFAISYTGSSSVQQDVLDLSAEQRSAFTAFQIDSRADLEQVWRPIREALSQVRDEQGRKKWFADHGPTIRQINHDLWKRACEILETDDRVELYYRMVLQSYLYNGRDIQCIASLVGKELTWEQIQQLTAKIEENQQQLDTLLADRRREIEAAALATALGDVDIDELRGEEFRWEQKPEDDHFRGFGIEEQVLPDDTMLWLASHAEVLDELGADGKTRKLISKAASGLRKHGGGMHAVLQRMAGAKTPQGREAIEQRMRDEKLAAEDEILANLRACFSQKQFQRLEQITFQQHLKTFHYTRALKFAGIELKGNALKGRFGFEFDVEHPARQEYQFARAQLAIDKNAKTFDEVTGTKLAAGLGKLIVFSYGTHHFGNPNEDRPRPVELYGERYGSHASIDLEIPDSLTVPPQDRVAWNEVEIPEGWKLADAVANLTEKTELAQQTVDGYGKWNAGRRTLRQAMIQAKQNGDKDKEKQLKTEYARAYSGREYFQARREFREALAIAQQEVSEARRMVKQLGGDPGPAVDWSVRAF